MPPTLHSRPMDRSSSCQISHVISPTSSILSAIFFPFVNTPGIENLQALKIANVCNQLVGSLSNATVQVFAQPAPVRNTWFKVFNFGSFGAMVAEKAIFSGYMIYAKVKDKDTKAADLANRADLGISRYQCDFHCRTFD